MIKVNEVSVVGLEGHQLSNLVPTILDNYVIYFTESLKQLSSFIVFQ